MNANLPFSKKKIPTVQKIIKLCKTEPQGLTELSEILKINKNTLRAKYLYPMVKANLIKKTQQLPIRKSNRYVS
jgi:hypothetical protein